MYHVKLWEVAGNHGILTLSLTLSLKRNLSHDRKGAVILIDLVTGISIPSNLNDTSWSAARIRPVRRMSESARFAACPSPRPQPDPPLLVILPSPHSSFPPQSREPSWTSALGEWPAPPRAPLPLRHRDSFLRHRRRSASCGICGSGPN